MHFLVFPGKPRDTETGGTQSQTQARLCECVSDYRWLQGFALNLLHLQPSLASIEIAGKCEKSQRAKPRRSEQKTAPQVEAIAQVGNPFWCFLSFFCIRRFRPLLLFLVPPADVTSDPLASRTELEFKVPANRKANGEDAQVESLAFDLVDFFFKI